MNVSPRAPLNPSPFPSLRNLGNVNTEHHHVALAVKSILDCMEEDEEEQADGEPEVRRGWEGRA